VFVGKMSKGTGHRDENRKGTVLINGKSVEGNIPRSFLPQLGGVQPAHGKPALWKEGGELHQSSNWRRR